MADEPQDSQEYVQVPLSWVGLEDITVLLANQFIIQYTDDGFLLTVGQVAPPPLLGSPEEQREQVSQLTFVPVRPLARFNLTERRLRELIAVLQENLSNYEAAMKERLK